VATGRRRNTNQKFVSVVLELIRRFVKSNRRQRLLKTLRKNKEIASEHSAKSVQRLRTNEDKEFDDEFERRLKELRSSPQASHQTSSIPTVKALEQRLEKLKATASDSSSPNTSKRENAHNPEPSVDKKDLLLPSKKTETEETLAQDEEISQRIYNLKLRINRPFGQNPSANIEIPPFNTSKKKNACNPEPSVDKKQIASDAKIEETRKAKIEETRKALEDQIQCIYYLTLRINKLFGQNPPASIQTTPFNTARLTEEQASETDPNVEISNHINYATEEHKLEEQKRKENDAFIASCEAKKYVNGNVTCPYVYAHV